MKISEPMPNIHAFSSGYYLVDGFFIEPNDDVSAPKIQDHVYAKLQDEYYGETSTPILFRANGANYHFRIEPADGVRSDTIEMPFNVVEEIEVDEVPSEQQFLMAKPKHAQMVVDLADPSFGR